MARVIRGAEVRDAAAMDAVEEATRILERARNDAEAHRERERAALREEAVAEADTRLAARHVELEARYQEERTALRAEITTLSIAVAEKILASEASTRPELIATWVDEALSRVSRATAVTVRVHPDDVGRLALGEPNRAVPDASLAPGDCVVESELGVIDGRLQVKLDALREALGAGST
ncbi:MAG: FliH/SctL family protein [Sandaracinaceae bacterium]